MFDPYAWPGNFVFILFDCAEGNQIQGISGSKFAWLVVQPMCCARYWLEIAAINERVLDEVKLAPVL
ncbi:hypothetical protein CPter291_5197 [Collimonas pratensis]|uniref:Uncharacterized protein n=1 Tax=Collimonas pratensis TaxID=279113 RepID=A0ABN4MPK0_9BURK|nr:hypothetical protein CPter291_5197 [Collimonas pratensis]